MAKKAKVKIVKAAGNASGGGVSGLAGSIEAAMSKAIADAAEAGITDQNEIRELMLAARKAARNATA